MSTDAMHGINTEHCTTSSACMHLSYCLLPDLLNDSALLAVPWTFLAGICSSWVSYPAPSTYSLLRKPFYFLCPWTNFNAPHVSYLSSQGRVPEFNKVWQAEVTYRRHRSLCSIINKIKVVSSIPSTWMERGWVGPRTSALLEMRKICCPCQESNYGYPGHRFVNMTRAIPALETWGIGTHTHTHTHTHTQTTIRM